MKLLGATFDAGHHEKTGGLRRLTTLPKSKTTKTQCLPLESSRSTFAAAFFSFGSDEELAKTLKFRSSEPMRARVKLYRPRQSRDRRKDHRFDTGSVPLRCSSEMRSTHPAKTPPSKTKPTLNMSFQRYGGLPGASSGSSFEGGASARVEIIVSAVNCSDLLKVEEATLSRDEEFPGPEVFSAAGIKWRSFERERRVGRVDESGFLVERRRGAIWRQRELNNSRGLPCKLWDGSSTIEGKARVNGYLPRRDRHSWFHYVTLPYTVSDFFSFSEFSALSLSRSQPLNCSLPISILSSDVPHCGYQSVSDS